jgi:hypothetical protein
MTEGARATRQLTYFLPLPSLGQPERRLGKEKVTVAELSYLDFDLLIESSQEGYRARILNSPGGQAVGNFSLPFSDLELENFLLRVGRTRRTTRRMESPDMEAAKSLGGRLFEAVFGGEVGACLRSSVEEAERQGAGLRVRLRLADAPELADLPWEYLYNPSLNRFLSLSVETPLVRYLDLPERIQPLAVKPPLRVLAMISSPSDYPPLDVEGEWARLQESLSGLEQRGLVTLERLEVGTLSALQGHLRRGGYHVFHFIGHGGFDQRAQDGLLIMEDDEGRGRPVSGQDLGTLLHDERTLRLTILNACEGARSSRGDPFAGAAQSLLQQGIPAVIAMQFEISDEAAITFAHEFYTALADGYPLDAALAEARKAIFAQGNDVEWGTPVLYLRSPDGRIFDVERLVDEEWQPDLVPVVPAPIPGVPEPVVASEQQDRIGRIQGWPTLFMGAIGLAIIVIAFIFFALKNVYLGVTISIALILAAGLFATIYVVFSKKDAPLVDGRRIYRLPEYRRPALAGIGLILILIVLLLAYRPSRSFAIIAFAGTPTPTATSEKVVQGQYKVTYPQTIEAGTSGMVSLAIGFPAQVAALEASITGSEDFNPNLQPLPEAELVRPIIRKFGSDVGSLEISENMQAELDGFGETRSPKLRTVDLEPLASPVKWQWNVVAPETPGLHTFTIRIYRGAAVNPWEKSYEYQVVEHAAELVQLSRAAEVRKGPGFEYAVIDNLPSGTQVQPIGRDGPSAWLDVAYGRNFDQSGWIPTGSTDVQNVASLALPVVSLATPLPTAAPTQGTMATPTPLPNATPTAMPTNTPGLVPESVTPTSLTPTPTPSGPLIPATGAAAGPIVTSYPGLVAVVGLVLLGLGVFLRSNHCHQGRKNHIDSPSNGFEHECRE